MGGSKVGGGLRKLDEMTFQGEKLSMKYYRRWFFASSAFFFLVSQCLSNFRICVWATVVNTILCVLVFGMGWPFWERSPLKFGRQSAISRPETAVEAHEETDNLINSKEG